MPNPKTHTTALESLALKIKSLPDGEKIEIVNRFFNSHIRYDIDANVWGAKDYWATPGELMARGCGDCEDIAIAKYFTLKESGMGDNKLRIIYGRLVTTGEAHIVLCYCESLILDNRVDAIMTVPDRSDFVQIVGFNCSGVWTFKRGIPEFVTRNSKRISKWRDLQERMNGRI